MGSTWCPVQSRPTRADLPALLAEPPRAAPARGERGDWLDGLKVVDLTNVVAGPTIGATLARFGAEVTSVQPVNPSVDPWNAIVFGLAAHRGKESVLLDLGSEAGRAALERLIAGADVVTMNGTAEQSAALGLAPGRLTARAGQFCGRSCGGRKFWNFSASCRRVALIGVSRNWRSINCISARFIPVSP